MSTAKDSLSLGCVLTRMALCSRPTGVEVAAELQDLIDEDLVP